MARLLLLLGLGLVGPAVLLRPCSAASVPVVPCGDPKATPAPCSTGPRLGEVCTAKATALHPTQGECDLLVPSSNINTPNPDPAPTPDGHTPCHSIGATAPRITLPPTMPFHPPRQHALVLCPFQHRPIYRSALHPPEQTPHPCDRGCHGNCPPCAESLGMLLVSCKTASLNGASVNVDILLDFDIILGPSWSRACVSHGHARLHVP